MYIGNKLQFKKDSQFILPRVKKNNNKIQDMSLRSNNDQNISDIQIKNYNYKQQQKINVENKSRKYVRKKSKKILEKINQKNQQNNRNYSINNGRLKSQEIYPQVSKRQNQKKYSEQMKIKKYLIGLKQKTIDVQSQKNNTNFQKQTNTLTNRKNRRKIEVTKQNRNIAVNEAIFQNFQKILHCSVSAEQVPILSLQQIKRKKQELKHKLKNMGDSTLRQYPLNDNKFRKQNVPQELNDENWKKIVIQNKNMSVKNSNLDNQITQVNNSLQNNSKLICQLLNYRKMLIGLNTHLQNN